MNYEKPVVIAHNRAAIIHIVSTDTAFDRAAGVLSDYFHRLTGANFPVQNVTDVQPDFVLRRPQDPENAETFCYYIFDKDIILEAADEQEAVWGVYDFLETVCGCRYYTSTEEYLPFDGNLTVQFSKTAHTSPLVYREVYYRDYFHPEFAEKHKMTAAGAKDQVWGFWCHSFATLCPPEEYFDSHPEYFSLYEGKRVKDSQLCLSNPEVFEIVKRNLAHYMAQKPECRFWSVSQNDNNAYCRCENCQKLDERDGTPMGSILNFVNRLAAEFPDKVISTLAYWYSRKPPKITRPAQNVHIMLCNIEANRGLPIASDELSKDSREELLAWEQICPNISLWDYCIQFRNLVSPFPNLRVIPQNIRFFTAHNVKMLFSQSNREYEGEFSALRGYLLAKCMWNPDVDENAVINEFCSGYYQQAAPYILSYINESTDAMEAAGGELSIFGGPLDAKDSWLDEPHYARYDTLMKQALEAVKGSEILTFRVKTAAMPVWYAGIVLAYGDLETRRNRITRFAAHARKLGLERVEEWKITPDQFITDAIAALEA